MSQVRLVRDVYEAFGRGDVPTVLGAFDAKFEWRQAEGHPYQPSGKAWVGPEAVVQNLFMRIGADWDGFTVRPKDFHDAVGTIVVEGRYTGTHKVTGKVLDAQFCHVWKIRSDRVTSFQQYVDTAQLQDVTRAR